MKRLGESASGRDNNFNLIRMAAASSVLLSHSWPVSFGPLAVEPFRESLGYSLGTISVLIFFSISGFFIAQSYDRSSSLLSFLSARFLRIYPGLTVVLVLTAFVLGAAFTVLPLGEYFSSADVYRYVTDNLLLVRMKFVLPGVFADHPFGGVNGSLWTLFYEVLCYGGVVLAGLAGCLSSRRFVWVLALFAGWQAAVMILHLEGIAVRHFSTLAMAFLIGTSFYVYRKHIILSPFLAAILCAMSYLTRQSEVYEYVFILNIAYVSFWLGHVGWLGQKYYNRIGDYSYGMYIFAFPIQQTVYAFSPATDHITQAAVSFALTLPLAILSWHFIESPALQHRERLTAFLGGKKQEKSTAR